MAEALAMTLGGALLGLFLAWGLVLVGRDYLAQLADIGLRGQTFLLAMLLAVLLAAIAALPPMLRVQRMQIVAALRHR